MTTHATRDTLSVWQVVELARHPDRPYSLDYIRRLAPDFVEMHGDRISHDDPAVVAGLGTWRGRTTVFLGQQKGRNLAERVSRNWGMMHPEGFRKAMRLARQAVKFGFPIIALVDTPGAYPGELAEERGIASAIGAAIMEWFDIPVPVVAVVIGEGGSGGALALGVGNRVYMMENAVYSVISPESCAAIIWRDSAKAELAAAALRLTAEDLVEFGLIDGIIPEPPGGAHEDTDAAAGLLTTALRSALAELAGITAAELIEQRYEKFRCMGNFFAEGAASASR